MKQALRYLGEGQWVAAGTCINLLSGLLIVRLLTNAMPPSEYGALALAVTGSTLVNQLALGGISNSIARYFVAAKSDSDFAGLAAAARQIFGYTTLITFTVAGVLAATKVSVGSKGHESLIILSALLATTTGLSLIVNSLLNAARKRREAANYLSLEALLKVCAVWWATTNNQNSPEAILLVYSMCSFAAASLGYKYISRSLPRAAIDSRQAIVWRKRLLAYAAPFMIWGPFAWIQQSSDRWALAAFSSVSETGLYTALHQIGYAPVVALTGVLTTTLGPILYSKANSRDRQNGESQVAVASSKVSLAILVGVTAVSLFLGFTHDIVFTLLVGPSYAPVSHLLPLAVLGGGVFASAQVFALQMMAEMRPNAMIGAKVATALVGTLLNVMGAAYFGVTGVVVGHLLYSGLLYAWMGVLRAPEKNQSLTL